MILPSLFRSERYIFSAKAKAIVALILLILALLVKGKFDDRKYQQHLEQCSMGTCFNLSRCPPEVSLKVHVYSNGQSNSASHSLLYSNILDAVKQSEYYTEDPNAACLFVLDVDTIDRDRISENYVKNVSVQVAQIPKWIWDGGQNHIIFNLYFGTYPNYADTDLGFDTGKAIITWASASQQNFRHNFDVSFPLFHKEHPLKNGEKPFQLCHPHHDQYLASFKGKRYVYGIGSETRSVLHHLHNGQSMVMATTCKHNTDWKKFEDERCQLDNNEYDRWDYDQLMLNSTFCLVPRGRRLGSFRFLEALRSACIPVILSDGWVLPFSEVIDWSEAVVIGQERDVLFIYDRLSKIPAHRVFRMRQTVQLLYNKYFSSVERIVLTAIEIVLERVNRLNGRPKQRNWMDLGS